MSRDSLGATWWHVDMVREPDLDLALVAVFAEQSMDHQMGRSMTTMTMILASLPLAAAPHEMAFGRSAAEVDAGPSVAAEVSAPVAKLDLMSWWQEHSVVVGVETGAWEWEAERWWRGSRIVPCMAGCLDSSGEVRILDWA